jgi:hypothetical protein
MSVGLQVLGSILDNGDRETFEQLEPEWFLETEEPAYATVLRFVRTYGDLPSRQAMLEQQVRLPQVSDTPAYYLRRLRHRAATNRVGELFPELNRAFEEHQDLDEASRVLETMLHVARHHSAAASRRPSLDDFCMTAAYRGDAPEPDWIVQDTLMRSTASLLAAMGGVGKTQMLLRLAHAIAAGPGGGRSIPRFQGGEILAEGTAVLITAQDSQGAIHRRLRSAGLPDTERLIAYPLVSAGGPMHLFRKTRDGEFETTSEYQWLRDELARLPSLQFVGIDPLQSFCPIDITTDVGAGNFVGDVLNGLASDLNVAVCASHHFSKSGQAGTTREDARNAVRGVTSLIDAFRSVYAIWKPDAKEAKRACELLGIEPTPGDPTEHLRRIYQGAVVKTNDAAEGPTQTYVRRQGGWDLIDLSADLPAAEQSSCNRFQQAGLAQAIISAVRTRAEAGRHLTRTNTHGVFENRHLLGEYHERSRDEIRGTVASLLAAGRLTTVEITRSGRRAEVLTAPDEAPGIAAMRQNVVPIRPEVRVRTRTPRQSGGEQ